MSMPLDNYRRLQNKNTKGFTLVDLMISILIGSILLVAIGQLLGMSRLAFQQIYGVSDVYNNGYEATQYLRMNIKKAGKGILYPGQKGAQYAYYGQAPDPYTSLSGFGTACYGKVNPSKGPSAVLPGWAYLGYFLDCTGPIWRIGNSNNAPMVGGSITPATCAHASESFNYNSANPDNGIYYSGVECGSQCFSSSPGYDVQSDLPTRVDASYSNANVCQTDAGHNCGGWCRMDIYQRLIPHIQVFANTNNSNGGDQLSMTFAIRNGVDNTTDCVGKSITLPAGYQSTTNVPVLVNNKFQVSGNNTLQCQTNVQRNGTWSTVTGWTDIIPNVENLKVMVGVSDNATPGSYQNNNGVNRYVQPSAVAAPALINGYYANTLDLNRIVSVRLSLIVRSSNNLLSTPTSTSFTPFPAVALIGGKSGYSSQTDSLLRKLFTTTIFLNEFIVPTYRAHCVRGASQYYIKMAGIPWVNSAVGTDKCCSNNKGVCNYYPSFNSCEAARYSMLNNCFGWIPP